MTQDTYSDSPADAAAEPTGWAGWIVFAAVMLILGGTLNALYGLVALFNDDWVVWGSEAALFLDLTGWGWLHVIVGGLVVLCGIGLLSGNMLARIVGVVIASINLIVNFFFIPVVPFWALTVIVLDVLVIYAICVHGRELKKS